MRPEQSLDFPYIDRVKNGNRRGGAGCGWEGGGAAKWGRKDNQNGWGFGEREWLGERGAVHEGAVGLAGGGNDLVGFGLVSFARVLGLPSRRRKLVKISPQKLHKDQNPRPSQHGQNLPRGMDAGVAKIFA